MREVKNIYLIRILFVIFEILFHTYSFELQLIEYFFLTLQSIQR